MVVELSDIAAALYAPALKVIEHGGAMHSELRDEFAYVCTHTVSRHQLLHLAWCQPALCLSQRRGRPGSPVRRHGKMWSLG